MDADRPGQGISASGPTLLDCFESGARKINDETVRDPGLGWPIPSGTREDWELLLENADRYRGVLSGCWQRFFDGKLTNSGRAVPVPTNDHGKVLPEPPRLPEVTFKLLSGYAVRGEYFSSLDRSAKVSELARLSEAIYDPTPDWVDKLALGVGGALCGFALSLVIFESRLPMLNFLRQLTPREEVPVVCLLIVVGTAIGLFFEDVLEERNDRNHLQRARKQLEAAGSKTL